MTCVEHVNRQMKKSQLISASQFFQLNSADERSELCSRVNDVADHFLIRVFIQTVQNQAASMQAGSTSCQYNSPEVV